MRLETPCEVRRATIRWWFDETIKAYLRGWLEEVNRGPYRPALYSPEFYDPWEDKDNEQTLDRLQKQAT